MPTLRSSESHYEDVQRLTALAVAAGRRSWMRLDEDDLDGSFRSLVGPELLIMLGAAQQAAASLADPYVDAALGEQNFGDAGQVGAVAAGAFAGVASDGRALPGLLRSPLTDVKVRIGRGEPNAVERALAGLDRILATQVADASRAAESVAVAARTRVGGWVRQLNPPSCSRCAILAGRWYRYSEGFQRHPYCDCYHVPAAEDAAGELTTSPQRYFESLSKQAQDATFGKAGAQAIRDGADMGQVVNARRGMRKAQIVDARITYEGITSRGYATNAPGSTVAQRRGFRLMPETIYEVATSRADAIRLLRANGYLR